MNQHSNTRSLSFAEAMNILESPESASKPVIVLIGTEVEILQGIPKLGNLLWELIDLELSYSSTIRELRRKLNVKGFSLSQLLLKSFKDILRNIFEDPHEEHLYQLISELENLRDLESEVEGLNIRFLRDAFLRLREAALHASLDDQLISEMTWKLPTEQQVFSLIDVNKLDYSSLLKAQIQALLNVALKYHDRDVKLRLRKVLNRYVPSIDELLAETFIGIFRGPEDTNFRNYLYISWLIWILMRLRASQAIENGLDNPLYRWLTDLMRARELRVYTSSVTTLLESVLSESDLDFKLFHIRGTFELALDLSDWKLIDLGGISRRRDEELERIEEIINELSANLMPYIVPPLNLRVIFSQYCLNALTELKADLDTEAELVIIGATGIANDRQLMSLIKRSQEISKIYLLSIDDTPEDLVEALKSELNSRLFEFSLKSEVPVIG